MTAAREIEVDGRLVRISNPDRLLWPEARFRKRQMLAYYESIAPVLLPHLRDRPIVLGRWPEGVDRPGWLQAECRGRPEWLPVHPIPGRKGQLFSYCVVNEVASLLHLANLGTIEFHPFLWRLPAVEPSFAVFDLDPGAPAGLATACRVALLVRERLDAAGLAGFAKTSGSLGLHVYVPLGPGQTFAAAKAFVRSVAHSLAEAHPNLVIESSARASRRGRVFVDWVQNVATRQTVAAYSLRATPWPFVSMPVTWDEVEETARSGRDDPLRFGPREALLRVRSLGDLWAPMLEPESGGVLPPLGESEVSGK